MSTSYQNIASESYPSYDPYSRDLPPSDLDYGFFEHMQSTYAGEFLADMPQHIGIMKVF